MAATDTPSPHSPASTLSVPPADAPPDPELDQPPMPPKIAAALAGLTALTGAVVGLLTSFNAVHWTSAQTTLVVTEVAAFWALTSAVTAHLWPQTKKQPVAVAGTVYGLRIGHAVLGHRIRLVAAHAVAKCVPDQPGHSHHRSGHGTGGAEHCQGWHDASPAEAGRNP